VTQRGGPLTDEEAQDLSIDELPGGGWMRLPVTAIGGYVKGFDELIAGVWVCSAGYRATRRAGSRL